MGQQEVLAVIEKAKVPMALKEIADLLNERETKASKYINILLRFNEIKSIELDKDLARKFYKSKRKMRLYYI